MKVRHIMTRQVETCRRGATLTQVVGRMKDGDCGFIPVIDDAGRVAGVITDRDVSFALIRTTRKPINVAAHEVMSSPVHACGPDDEVRAALSTMERFRIRRLPVIDRDGTLKGILSIDDVILRALAPDAPSSEDILISLRAILRRDEPSTNAAREEL